jgi:hypothetical protein
LLKEEVGLLRLDRYLGRSFYKTSSLGVVKDKPLPLYLGVLLS